MTIVFADNFEELTGITEAEFAAGKEITSDVIGTSSVTVEVPAEVSTEVSTEPEKKVLTADSPEVATA